MSALDTLYEIVGNRFPITSQIIACLVGAIVFGFVWYSIGRHYRNEHARTANVPAVSNASPPTPVENSSPSVPQTSAREKPRSVRDQTAKQPSALNQTMTNSAGGIQAGRDVTIGQKPSPTATEKDRKP